MRSITAAVALALLATSANATFIEQNPCVEKTLITRAPSKKESPAKPSPIIAWVTVRSGGPIVPDAPRCTEEVLLAWSPEPEILGFEPLASIPEPVEWIDDQVLDVWPASRPPFWIYGGSGSPHFFPPSRTPTNTVPEPSALALFALGVVGVFASRRKQA